MKSYHFFALKLMTSLCLLMFVSLAATSLQAQEAKHTTTLALWEVEDGKGKFALWNIHSKEYLEFTLRTTGSPWVKMVPLTNFHHEMEKLSNGTYQVEYGDGSNPDVSLLCCKGGNNDVYPHTGGGSADDLIFEEVRKDVFRIKFKHNGTYLTVGGQGSKEVYGTTIKMGDHQLWSITGR